MSDSEILFDVEGGLGRITLNRPKALNALTLAQIRAMDPHLRRWAEDPAVRVVLIRGAGQRAFCAGGDVRAIYDARQRGDWELVTSFYREEYRLNRLIKTYPKPYVALADGIVMGGGVGVSVHGTYRVCTEATLFAMPETGIGLFPDVGGTFFLPRCPGALGVYLALTGARLSGADLLYCGYGTHCVPQARLADLTRALAGGGAVQAVLDDFHQHPGEPGLAARRALIDRCFTRGAVEVVLAALADEADPWADDTAALLRTRSPTALKVTLRQMFEGGRRDFDACMRLEYRMMMRFMRGHEFFEGVRAQLVDKDQKPRWVPDSLDQVGDEDIEAYLEPLDDLPDVSFEP